MPRDRGRLARVDTRRDAMHTQGDAPRRPSDGGTGPTGRYGNAGRPTESPVQIRIKRRVPTQSRGNHKGCPYDSPISQGDETGYASAFVSVFES